MTDATRFDETDTPLNLSSRPERSGEPGPRGLGWLLFPVPWVPDRLRRPG